MGSKIDPNYFIVYGGYNWLNRLTYDSSNSGVISRMDLAVNTIRWMKSYWTYYYTSNHIYGLALNPGEDKVAVYGQGSFYGDNEG